MKKLSTWLIAAGIILIAIPIVGAMITQYQQDQLYKDYLNSQEMIESIQAMDEAFSMTTGNEAATEASISVGAVTGPAVESYKPTVIGRVKIPKASINLLLVEGTSAKDLNWGAGHMTTTPMPGQIGNTAIAGHRNYTFGSYFSRLGEVAVGDSITVEYKGKNYTYEAYEILTVLPDDTSVLRQTNDHAILTLITCAPKGSNTHRLIIHAKLIS